MNIAALNNLHDLFDRHGQPGYSKGACILCALTVRDYFRGMGFPDAEVRPVGTLLLVDGKAKIFLGKPGTPTQADQWDGHLVTVIPSKSLLIDLTLERLSLGVPGFTVPLDAPGKYKIGEYDRLAHLKLAGKTFTIQVAWIDIPQNTGWKHTRDAQEAARSAVVRGLLTASPVPRCVDQTTA